MTIPISFFDFKKLKYLLFFAASFKKAKSFRSVPSVLQFAATFLSADIVKFFSLSVRVATEGRSIVQSPAVSWAMSKFNDRLTVVIPRKEWQNSFNAKELVVIAISLRESQQNQ